MKRYILITTFLLLLLQLLTLPALAVDTIEILPQSTTILYSTSTGSMIETELSLYPRGSVPSNYTNIYANNSASQFDYYYHFLANLDTSANFTSGSFICQFESDNFKEYNAISFDVSVFVHPENTDYKNSFSILINDDETFDKYTLTYTVSNIIRGTSSTGTTYAYRKVFFKLLLNEPYRYDSFKMNFKLSTYLPPMGQTVGYCFGVNPIVAEVMTQEEYVSSIAGSVANVQTELEVLNEQTVIISDNVTEIKELLMKEMSPEDRAEILEGQQKLEEQRLILLERQEQQRQEEERIELIFTQYKNLEYDLFGDHYGEYIIEYVDPVFDEANFFSFWEFLFNHEFIIGLIIVSLTFCGVGFVLYGVR